MKRLLYRAKQKDVMDEPIEFIDLALGLLFVVLFAYMCYLIFDQLVPFGLSADLAGELSYFKTTFKEMNLFPENYVTSTEALNNRPFLLYWLFYGITGNFILSYQMEDLCTLVLQLLAVDFFLRSFGIKRRMRLVALCIYLAWMPFSILNILIWPANTYVLFWIDVLFSLAMRNLFWKRFEIFSDIKKQEVWLPAALFLLPAVTFSYSTPRMIAVLYIPLLLMDGLRLVLDFINRRPIQKRLIFTGAVSLIAMLANGVAYVFFLLRHGNSIYPSAATTIQPMSAWMTGEVFFSQFQALADACGLAGSGPLRSASGIRFVVSAAVVFLLLLAVLWLMRNEPQDSGIRELVVYWFSFTAVTLGINILWGITAVQSRYYFITALMLPLLFSCALFQWVKRTVKKPFVFPCWIILGLLSVLIVVANADNMSTFTCRESDLTKASDYIRKSGYKYMSAEYEYAGWIRCYTNGQIETLYSNGPNTIVLMQPFYYMIDTDAFDQEHLGEPTVLFITDNEEEEIFNQRAETAVMLENYAQKVAEFGDYNLYELHENPFTLVKKARVENRAGLPGSGETSKEDEPGSIGFQYQHAMLNEAGELVSDGTAACVLYGPYTDSVAGVYDITLHYVVEDYGDWDSGIFDVALNAESVASVIFTADETEVMLDDVEINDGYYFETRVQVPDGMIIRVQSIDYQRENP